MGELPTATSVPTATPTWLTEAKKKTWKVAAPRAANTMAGERHNASTRRGR